MNDTPGSGRYAASRQPIHLDQPVQPTNSFIPFSRDAIEQSIAHRFKEQVRHHRDRTAIRSRTQELTYGALNAAANRVARAIRSSCGDAPQPVALMFEHDAPMLVAILATLKAGMAYLPLDPRYPADRLGYMLDNSRACLIVTNKRNATAAGALTREEIHLVNIDELDADLSTENLELPVSAGAVACIIYTSGSTGAPKGVPQLHRNVLHEIMNYTNAAHLSKDDRLLLVSSCCFADSIRTIFGALLNGASLFPLSIAEEGLTGLADWLIRNKITVYRSVPTVFRHFGGMIGDELQFPDIRLIYMAGEPVYRTDVELFHRHFSPHCIFVNGLGSTESLTYRWFFMGNETPLAGENVPVGYAIDDMEVLLLGMDEERATADGIGEIAVKSRYLSPGYWHNPELTSTRFRRAGGGTDERIFLTGDLGRLLPDGRLLHMGRKDSQVKIRGHRIEIAEIEMLLVGMEGIKEAVVAPQEAPSGHSCLVAYLVPARDQTPAVADIRRLIAETLPDYMVPSAFVNLKALPLLPNGKVNRRALPVPDWTRSLSKQAYVAPRTPLEDILAGIWSGVLGIKQIGVHDHFLDLGGHSLLATQIISRIHRDLRVELPLRSIFENPTVAQIAALLDPQRK